MLMSNIQSAVHSFLKVYDEKNFDLAFATEKINELIFENTTTEKFITFFWGILDTDKNTFTYINAGHNQPIHFCNNNVLLMDKGGLMLGVLEKEINYETGIATLDKNCLLLFYTDGVTEAVNKDNEELGEEKLISILTTNHHHNTGKILEIIKNEIENHSKGLPQYDDITLIVLKKNR